MTTARRVSQRPKIDLADLVAELTRPHTNRTRYEVRGRGRSVRSKYNQVKVPSLLHQLEHAVPQITRDERSTAGYESRPTAHLEALDTLMNIDQEVTLRLEQLGKPTAGRPGQNARTLNGEVTARVRRVYGSLPELRTVDPKFARELERDLRRWHAQARVVTGWDTPPWRPDSTCPMCDERRTLRVRWHEEVGMCTHCFDTWDSTTIGLLADHVRLEAEFSRSKRITTVPACWCPLPMPQPTTLRLCPACGSARCHRALTLPYERDDQ